MKQTKRYMLFGYNTNDSNGGLNDLGGSFDEVKEAVAFVKGLRFRYRHYDLFDRIKGIEVEDFEKRLNI